MKTMANKINYSSLLIIILVCFSVFLFGFSSNQNKNPRTLYQIYLDGQKIGVINSKDEFENIMNSEQVSIKEKYNVSNVYIPKGVEIKKIVSYTDKVSSARDIYNKLIDIKSFTVKGYHITVKHEEIENEETGEKTTPVDTHIYVLDKKVFDDALEMTIKAFVKEEDWKKYINNDQDEVEKVGEIIKNVDKSEIVLYSEDLISTDNVIWTNSEELAKYLLYGKIGEQEKYIVQDGDTIDTIAEKYKLNTQEFLIANPVFTSANNLLYPLQEVNVGLVDPLINIVVDTHSIEEQVNNYKIEVQYDENKAIGYQEILREGEDGLIKAEYQNRYVNGQLSETILISQNELKPAINSVVIKGSKYIPDVADASYWQWPTNLPCRISSGYGYRWGSLHAAIDIIGPGYGSPIYAANNGVVYRVDYGDSSMGNYVMINHNYKKYYTVYYHMKELYVKEGEIVSRGQIIGLMGNTGYVVPKPTANNPYGGTHLHFGVYVGRPYNGGYSVNPKVLFDGKYRCS